MATAAQLEHLQQWLKDHGGFLHPSVKLVYREDCGVHVRATARVDANTGFCTVPHSLALSSLNAYVDDGFPVFKQSRRELSSEAVGYFYLMYQYINRASSFWRPYLESLPQPGDLHCTPFWFEERDLAWLEDTDVLHSTNARKKSHESQYRDGLDLLGRAGVDTHPYSWDLFRWAVTMFTSRSFSSRAIHPQESKYWTAYKGGVEGRRQTVLLDLSRSPAKDLDFPVLFPVADTANHRADARAEWAFDPGRFSITVKDPVSEGQELFNNYGPKANAELLLGYGFCIRENPYDSVLLTLRPPPRDLEPELRRVHPGYFTSNGEWSGEKATFALRRITFDDASPSKIFEAIPEPLLELMLYILRHERGLPFVFVENPFEHLSSSSSSGCRYLPHLARTIVQSLAPKLSKLQSSTPEDGPCNPRQEQAQIYRMGQIAIIESVNGALRSFTRSLLPSHPLRYNRGPLLVTLELLLELVRDRGHEAEVKDFLDGIAARVGTADADRLREAGWEDDVVVLLLCYLHIFAQNFATDGQWIADTVPEQLALDYVQSPGLHVPESDLEQAQDLLQVVLAARETCKTDSTWHDPKWNAQFVAAFGGGFVKHDSFSMMVPTHLYDGSVHEEVRSVIYIHRQDSK